MIHNVVTTTTTNQPTFPQSLDISPGLPKVSPKRTFIHPFWGVFWGQLVWDYYKTRCLSCHATDSVKTLQGEDFQLHCVWQAEWTLTSLSSQCHWPSTKNLYWWEPMGKSTMVKKSWRLNTQSHIHIFPLSDWL